MNVMVLRFVILFTVLGTKEGIVAFAASTLAEAVITWSFLRIISPASILSIRAV